VCYLGRTCQGDAFARQGRAASSRRRHEHGSCRRRVLPPPPPVMHVPAARASCACARAHREPKAGPLPALVPPSPLLPCSGGRSRRQPCRRVRNLERWPRPCLWPTLLPVRARPCPKAVPFARLMAGDEPPLPLDIAATSTSFVVAAPTLRCRVHGVPSLLGP